MASLLTSDSARSPRPPAGGPPPAARLDTFRVRLGEFADVARALAAALEAQSPGATFVRETAAVRAAFGRVPAPAAPADGRAGRYRVARDIATADCRFVLWAAGRRRAGGPDLVLGGYARWVREQLALLRA